MPGRVRLGAEDVVDLFRGERADDAVGGDARGVHDGGQRVVRTDAGDQFGQCVAVADVARLDTDLGAGLGQLRHHFGGTFRGHSAPADQKQVADAVLGDQVTGDERAQSPGTSRDQHGARADRPRFPCVGTLRLAFRGRHPDEPGNADAARADGQLGLAGGDGARQGCPGGRVVVQVGQQETARVLGLRRAHHAPHRGTGKVGDRVVVHGDRARGGHHQGVRLLLVLRSRLENGEDGVRGRAHPVRDGRGDVRDHFMDLHGPGRRYAPCRTVGQRRPGDTEEGRVDGGRGAAVSGGELVGRHRAGDQRVHGQDGCARAVGGDDPYGARVGLLGGHLDPQQGGPGGVQPDAVPGEGD